MAVSEVFTLLAWGLRLYIITLYDVYIHKVSVPSSRFWDDRQTHIFYRV